MNNLPIYLGKQSRPSVCITSSVHRLSLAMGTRDQETSPGQQHAGENASCSLLAVAELSLPRCACSLCDGQREDTPRLPSTWVDSKASSEVWLQPGQQTHSNSSHRRCWHPEPSALLSTLLLLREHSWVFSSNLVIQQGTGCTAEQLNEEELYSGCLHQPAASECSQPLPLPQGSFSHQL